ncbi:RICIN domain-containing protein [Corallococcus macrosporus]|uniref:Ricin b lectin n=1 Tax=Myxococcus fulvus (strain ATCC BAA-855 / HW-1) TaxID=483219 RepID=F8CH14_MYXFH|nr:RICIN domain-containing protein [Corallococcus macrosporus]AEI64931.1 ricin b lectin [Corallococcus macrosporus]
MLAFRCSSEGGRARENRSSVKARGWAALALLLLPLTASAGPGPSYRWDESRNRPGPNRCQTSAQCDGARTCSSSGWCQGEARPTPPPPPPSHNGRDWRPERDTRPQRGTFIRSRLEGLVIDIVGGNRAPGAGLVAFRAKSNREGNENQKWELVPTRGGYLIRSRLNGLVLDVEGANKAPGTAVVMWEAHGQPHQVWQLVPGRVRGTYYIQSKLNGLVLDIEGARTDGSGRLITYPMKRDGTAQNQLWKLDI